VDHSLRFKTLQLSTRHRQLHELMAVHTNLHDGAITCAVPFSDGRILTAGDDCAIRLWTLHSKAKIKYRQLRMQSCLRGHSARVCCVAVSIEFNVIVSGAQDGKVMVWDLNSSSLSFVLPQHPAPISAIAVNAINGEVVTCAGSCLFVWTINGDLIAECRISDSSFDRIQCVAWSKGMEWRVPNVIITGHQDGRVRFWKLASPQYEEEKSSLVTAAESPTSLSSASSVDSSSSASSSNVAESKTKHKRNKSSMSSFKINLVSAPAPIIKSGRPYMRLWLRHECGNAHNGAVTTIYTTLSNTQRVWTGDQLGVVIVWRIVNDDHWVKDEDVRECSATTCDAKFGRITRRHHCRVCGFVFCSSCSSKSAPAPQYGFNSPVRMCDPCYKDAISAKQKKPSVSW
jgi:WD40 repeat protein